MSLYNIKVKNVEGEWVELSKYKGKVLIVVNIATAWSLTPQLQGLEELYQKYQDDGLEIIGFPCNQFLAQNKQDGKGTVSFCSLNYGVTFENYERVDINGENESPLYTFLKKEKSKDIKMKGSRRIVDIITSINQFFVGSDIKWHFTKFLIDRDGNVAQRYAPTFTAEAMEDDVVKLLKK